MYASGFDMSDCITNSNRCFFAANHYILVYFSTLPLFVFKKYLFQKLQFADVLQNSQENTSVGVSLKFQV